MSTGIDIDVGEESPIHPAGLGVPRRGAATAKFDQKRPPPPFDIKKNAGVEKLIRMVTANDLRDNPDASPASYSPPDAVRQVVYSCKALQNLIAIPPSSDPEDTALPEELGCGFQGCVYPAADPRGGVIKVTFDGSEAGAALFFKNYRQQVGADAYPSGFPEVFAVYQLKSCDYTNGEYAVYAIYREDLPSPVDHFGGDENSYNEYSNLLKWAHRRKSAESVRKAYDRLLAAGYYAPGGYELLHNAFHTVQILMREGFKIHDAHIDNWGIRNTPQGPRLVLRDFGLFRIKDELAKKLHDGPQPHLLGLTVAQVQPGIWTFAGLGGGQGEGEESSEATGRTFLAYHGSHRWESPAEIRPLRKGHAEHGPGIYFTTGYETAAKYAKGGGSVGLFTLAAPRAWAHQVSLDPGEVEAFLKDLRGLKGRPGLLADVKRITERMKGKVPAESLVNLFVNGDQASGQTGVELARFLVERGVDALYVPRAAGRAGDEEWFVLLNPRLVLSRQVVSPKGEIVWDLPLQRAGRYARSTSS